MNRIVECHKENASPKDSVEATVPGLMGVVLRLREAFPSLSKDAIEAALGLPETGSSRTPRSRYQHTCNGIVSEAPSLRLASRRKQWKCATCR